MSVFNLDRVFHPKSVAVIGASEKPGTVGASVMQNLISGGYTGDIYPVHPRYRRVYGRKAHPWIGGIGKAADLAIIVTPIAAVPYIIRDCAAGGCGGAVIISAGGKEAGLAGVLMEKKIQEAAAGSGLRIIGPNCLGVMCSRSNLNASFAGPMPREGSMAFVSQSGAICTAILDFAARENLGFSFFASLGSMLDADFGDIIDFFGNDPRVTSIVMYVENLTRHRNFMSAARAVSRVKPVIAFKAGRSRAGAMAAASHTGAMAGEDDVYDAAFKRAGIVRVRTFEELFDCAEFIAKQPRPEGHGLAIVTNSGGTGVMAADSLSDYGVAPANLLPPTIERLNAVLPPFWSGSNPVDILGDATAERYVKAVDILLADPSIQGLLIMWAPQSLTDPVEVAEKLAARLNGTRIPIITAWMGGMEAEKGRRVFNHSGISTFDTPERAVRAFMDLYKFWRINRMLQEVPPSLPQKPEFDRDHARKMVRKGLERAGGQLTETESTQLLAAYGIPANPLEAAENPDAAAAIAMRMGFPVALKIQSPDISRKTDAGGVVVNIPDASAVREVFTTTMKAVRAIEKDAPIEGISLQKILAPADFELIIGARQDKDFGPVIRFKMGGIFSEILQEQGIALPPMNRLLARRLMEETKISRIFNGYRNLPAVDTRLEEILIRLSQLLTDFPELAEIDLSPLMIGPFGIIAAKARVVVQPAQVPAPLHLVISPYPVHQETHVVLDDGNRLLIRPIRPEDAPLLESLFAGLSSQSLYFRFFSPTREVPPQLIARFTQIDYDREVALVAVQEDGDGEKMMGVARIIQAYDGKNAEFAIVVGDQWHGRGIGARLLKRCLALAWMRGIKQVYGLVMADNVNMLALGRKLGFTIRMIPRENAYELTLNFEGNTTEAAAEIQSYAAEIKSNDQSQ